MKSSSQYLYNEGDEFYFNEYEELRADADDHAGAELCRFDAAHMLPRTIANFGNSGGPGTRPHPE